MTSYYFWTLFFGTFVLEDVALATAITFAHQGKITTTEAFLAVFAGITVGDVGIYLIGLGASKWNWLRKFKFINKVESKILNFGQQHSIGNLVVISRFVPGTRVVTYLLAGLSQYSFWKFNILTVVSVFGWVLIAFIGGQSVMALFRDHWILSILFLFLFLQITRKFIQPLFNKWDRLVLFNSWRKWMDFEFWPAWFFYIPLYFFYTIKSVRYRSFLIPFYINPEVHNGGVLGESKWDFLQHLDPKSPTTLNTVKLKKGITFAEVEKIMMEKDFRFPVILKPDVGQRGFGVRIMRSFDDIKHYLAEASFDLILQNFSLYKHEAGLFYIRYPEADYGFIFSITDKQFPFVVGDGVTNLGKLIARDSRAQIMLGTYFDRHRDRLESVPAKGEKVYISECGNHCQGALFFNGESLKTPELEKAVNNICLNIPHFYFGRLDVRYESASLLKQGKNFEIVEINGAGAEATHIWDPRTKILSAYKTLFQQWSILFAIGYRLKNNKNLKHQVDPIGFLKESAKVFFRKEKLSTSS